MIKLSVKFDLSLGNILLGFAGISVAACAYKFYSPKKNIVILDEYDHAYDNQQNYCTEDNVSFAESTSNSNIVSEVIDPAEVRNESKTVSKRVVNQSKTSFPSTNTSTDEGLNDDSVLNRDLDIKVNFPLTNESMDFIEPNKFNKVDFEKYFFEVIENQKSIILLRFHKNEIGKVITETENTDVSFEVIKKLSKKRLQQLEPDKNKHFVANGHLVEQKAWEILTVTTKKHKTSKFNNSKQIFKLISSLYDNLIMYLERNIEVNVSLLKKEDVLDNYSKLIEHIDQSMQNIYSFKGEEFKECIDNMKTDLLQFYGRNPLINIVSNETEVKSTVIANEIEKYIKGFEKITNYLLENNFLTLLDIQQKNLKQVLKELSFGEITTENYTALINKRIKQLKEVIKDNDVNIELFKCEITEWTILSTDKYDSLTNLSWNVLENIEAFYGHLTYVLNMTKNIKLKLKNSIHLGCEELNDLSENFYILLDTIRKLPSRLNHIILLIVVTLQVELMDMF